MSHTILLNWQQPQREFISSISSPYYSNDHCQSWWISVRIIDLKIWERGSLSMAQWGNGLVLWANPLGTLIRIKCLSHPFSVADRNNESLNIVFQEKKKIISAQSYFNIVHISSYSPPKDNTRSNFKDICRQRWTKIKSIKHHVLKRLIRR